MRRPVVYWGIKLGAFWLDQNGGWCLSMTSATVKLEDRKEIERLLKKILARGYGARIARI
jgi:hypothetical protein